MNSDKQETDKQQRYFRFGLRGVKGSVWLLRHPLPARNMVVRMAQEEAVNAVLSNYSKRIVTIPNFSRVTNEAYGFSRTVFQHVLSHMHNTGEVKWTSDGFKSSTILYQKKVNTGKLIELPPYTMVISVKKGSEKMKLNTKDKCALDKRISNFWKFLEELEILDNVDSVTYNTVSDYSKMVNNKDKFPPPPDSTKIFPVAVYNNRSASIGGRFYKAFWIGESKTLRRLITIDGELTDDVDGDSMHVQLLYRIAGKPLPDGELYLYKKPDEQRDIAKRLMLYMMNTRKSWKGKEGRDAVIRTYKKHHDNNVDLMPILLKLETKHKAILHLLYQSNWGQLQNTEAGIMLEICEKGMIDHVPVLPVHDGCLCKRSDSQRVLQYFDEVGIRASINKDHRRTVDIKKMRHEITARSKKNLL